MKRESEPIGGDQSDRCISRRDFLWRGAAVPGIVFLSACGARRESPPTATGTEPAAEYELNPGSQVARPDGRDRTIFCYDGQLPGPLIRAKLGQKLRIKVNNRLPVPTTVHWHGMHQPGTWRMDGVEGVTQEAISPNASFVYEFEATPAGTHWYHSHTGVQYGDGLFGPLIVDEVEPPAKYDREHILLINDWFLKSAEEILAGLVGPKKMDGAAMSKMKGMAMKKEMGAKPDIGDVPFESALFNGQGRFAGTEAPLAEVEVKPGEVIRLRLINGSSTYAFRFQIDGHPLTVIATDGAPIAPVEVDNLVFGPGERYDVLVTAQGAAGTGAAWIRAATLAGDEARAVLRYEGAPEGEPTATEVVWGDRALTPEALRSPTPVTLGADPREVVLRLGGTMQPYEWNINDQRYPNAEPVAVARDEWLRFVLDNPTGMDHPFHLHGHYFYVLGPPDRPNLADPPRKDTVNVPAGGKLALAWQAVNPGRWFFHCHIEWHVATGMARVIEIGSS